MRVLIVEPRYYSFATQPYFPHGPAYVAASLIRAGHEVEVFNANMEPGTVEEVCDRVAERAAGGGCGLVAMGGLCTTWRFQAAVFRGLRRRLPRLPLASGGNLFTSEPELCMREFGLDYGIVGEGEETAVALCDALEAGTDPARVEGIALMRHGEVTLTPRRRVIADLDTLPLPAWDLFLTREQIVALGGMSVFSSRSCPFHCTFCYHPKGSYYRKRSVQSVLAEILALHERYGFHFFAFSDELMGLHKDWVRELCAAFATLPFDIGWVCQMRASDADGETLAMMREAGCMRISMGFESGSDTVLKSMRKRITTEVSKRAIATARAAGLPVTGGIIVGDYDETPRTIAESVEFIKQTALVPVGDIGFIVPFPGSQIYERAVAQGLITDRVGFIESLSDFGKLRVNMTGMSDAELIALQEWASREVYAHFLAHRRGEVLETLAEAHDRSTVRCRCQGCGEEHEREFQGLATELQFYCPACRYPLYFSPFDIPHMERATRGFRQRVLELAARGARLAVTPTGRDFMRLTEVLPEAWRAAVGFLDASDNRLAHPYMERPVRLRTKSEALALRPDAIVVCSVAHGGAIAAEVRGWELPGVEVLSFTG